MLEIIVKISAEQFALLDSWGGRKEEDLCVDSKGLYVIMTDGHEGQRKVYLDGKKVYNKKVALQEEITRLTNFLNNGRN